ncbi:MAG TPA: J domain-containing protein [Puia sp.]|nr:J domain-containing protein [Puia sp.]
MDFIDYYKVLGVNKNATADEIRAAYRKLARKHHPDLNPDDKDANKRFQQINEANEVLSDPEKRKKYDQYGKDWMHAEAFEKAQQSAGGHGGRPGSQGFGGGAGFGTGGFGGAGGEGEWHFSDGGEFSDFFESLFGGSAGGRGQGGRSQGRQARFRGQDYQAQLEISLADAATTHQRILTVNGKNIRITIPAGVENGQVIKLKGHGAPGANGGPDGDLYITFSIADDPRWTRDGNDLHMKAPLDLYTAILGGELTVDTLTGKVKLRIKPETPNSHMVRLKGKGFPIYKQEGQFGDLYVTLDIKLPTNLTEKEKELFRQLAAIKH